MFTPDNIHLYAGRRLRALRGEAEAAAGGFPGRERSAQVGAQDLPGFGSGTPARSAAKPAQVNAEPAQAKQVIDDGKARLTYPYAPYNEGKMDPQLTGWPLTDAEKAWVAKSEYTRKPGHEVQKHLPEMWFVTPTAARWGKDGEENVWVAHHATCIEKVQAMKDGIDIALLGDSITQGWGGGWDGAPFNAAWQKHFGDMKTVNLGIGGDRMENILWRLDHGALDGASPKVIVLHDRREQRPARLRQRRARRQSAAHGIKLCIENLRMRCPKSQIVLVKILPAFDPARKPAKTWRHQHRARRAETRPRPASPRPRPVERFHQRRRHAQDRPLLRQASALAPGRLRDIRPQIEAGDRELPGQTTGNRGALWSVRFKTDRGSS